MFCRQGTKANGVRALFAAAGKNLQCNMVLSDVLGGHIIPLIALFAEIWNTHGKSLRAQVIYINSPKQNQAQYTPQESIISKFTKKPKGSSAQHKPYIESSKSRNLFKSIIYKTQPN